MEKYHTTSAYLINKKSFRDFIPIRIFILFTFHLSLLTIYSQPVTQEWVRRYSGPINDLYGPFLAVDKQGNSYIAGTHVVNDTPKVLCVKYNTQGVQQWASFYIYPGEAYIRPTGLAIDSSGNAYVTSAQGPAYYLPTNGLIVKFNGLNGSLVWAKKYVGQYSESSFLAIKIDRLNNIYVTGTSDTSHLVIRYNTNGDSVWVRKYHPRPLCGEGAWACALDDSFNIIFTGLRRFYYPPYGYYDSLLAAKYSPGGVLRWESVYAYNYLGANVGTKIVTDQNGSIYIGGVTTVSGLGVYLTLKYDRNGVRQWAKIFNSGVGDNNLNGITLDRIRNCIYVTGKSPGQYNSVCATISYNSSTGDSVWVRRDTGTYKNAGASDIDIDSSGNIYITGATNNIPPGSAIDILSIKYSPQGNRVWLITYNGPFNGWDGGKAIILDNTNNVYVLGTSQSGAQVTDYVLIKYNQLNAIKPISNEIPQEFRLKQNYPNPFNSTTIIKFSIPKKSFVQLRIYDVLGKIKEVVVNEQLHPSEYETAVDASNYSNGTYFYQLIADGNVIETKKMVLVK